MAESYFDEKRGVRVKSTGVNFGKTYAGDYTGKIFLAGEEAEELSQLAHRKIRGQAKYWTAKDQKRLDELMKKNRKLGKKAENIE